MKGPSLYEHRQRGAKQVPFEIVDCPPEWSEPDVVVEAQKPHDTFVGLMNLPVETDAPR